VLPSRAFFTLRPTDVACVDLSMPWKLCGLANSANLVAGRNIIGRDQASQSELSVPMGETKLQLGITAKSVSRRHAVLTQAAAGSLRLETVSKTVPTCVVRGSHVHVLFNNQPYMEMQAGDLIVPNGNTLLRDLLPEAVNPSQGYSAPEVAAARPIQVTEANLVKITAVARRYHEAKAFIRRLLLEHARCDLAGHKKASARRHGTRRRNAGRGSQQ
jgi:hypothetical protein